MMSVINMSYQNSSSSIMQAKFLRFLEDVLITPLSGFEISLAYILGATVRGLINGIVVFLLSWLLADFYIEIPSCSEELTPILSNIPLQLLSYHIALMRGCNVDQPRNLAKSVTVE